MKKISAVVINEMIITCEACGNVKHYSVNNEADCNRIFNNFRCENNCGRNLYSFITVGTVKREPEPALQEA